MQLWFVAVAAVVAAAPAARSHDNDRAVPRATEIREKLHALADWTMTLDVGTNHINNGSTIPNSIFINGNLARTLIAAHTLFNNESYLHEALRWCDTLVSLQNPINTSKGNPGAWFDTGYNELYIADTGTAVTALALCYFAAPEQPASRKANYVSTLSAFARFVIEGCLDTPAGGKYGRGCPPKGQGWVRTSDPNKGALGDGYYQNELNLPAYTIATATTGSCFFPHLYRVLQAEEKRNRVPGSAARLPLDELKQISIAAAAWLVRVRAANGSIPYIITPPTTAEHTYQSISYSAESFVAVDRYFAHDLDLSATVNFVVSAQNPNGSWGAVGSGESERSPRAATLVQWYLTHNNDPAAQQALEKYVGFVLDNWSAYKVGQDALVSGFVGLTLADYLQPWVTFAPTQN